MCNLISQSDNEISSKFDFAKVDHLLIQFKLFKKLILNESQCFMLKNTELKVVTGKEQKDTNEEKKKNRKLHRESRERQGKEGELNLIDKILISYLPNGFSDNFEIK